MDNIGIGPEVRYHDRDDRKIVFRFDRKYEISFPRRILLEMQATLPDDNVLPFVAPISGADKFGNPTTLAGNVKVTSSDITLFTILQPDPFTPTVLNSGTIVPTGKLGTAQVTFEDDTDGPSPLMAILTITVVAGGTVSLIDPTIGAPRPAAQTP